MFDDLVGTDDDDGRQPLGPALMLGPKMGPSELQMYHAMWLYGSPPGARELLFTGVDDQTGVEDWEPVRPPTFHDEAARWQKLMNWPSAPTIEEAQAFQNHARAKMIAEWWDRLASARTEDDERRPG